MTEKIKRTKLDKIGSSIVCVGTILVYFIDKSKPFLNQYGLTDFIPIIPFVSALSLFCFVWSFIWENKVQRLYEKISDQEDSFVNRQNELNQKVIYEINKHNELSNKLSEFIKGCLAKPECIESRILKEHESNIEKYLKIDNPSNEVALIYIITNDADVENDEFGSVICKNIIKNCYYIYITPFEDQKFKNKILDTLLRKIPEGITEESLKAIFTKRIIHFYNEDLFKWLPAYSDIVIYTKKKRDKWRLIPDEIHGFYSFQNKAEVVDGVDCYFYKEMTSDYAHKLINCFDNLDNTKLLNTITKNHYSNSVKKERGGLYCKNEIKKGEEIFNVDGIFLKKNKLNQKILEKTAYLQFDDEYVVETELPINHSCKEPNCGISENFKIIAIKDISVGTEILIDYAFFDPAYEKFECNFHNKCGECTRKTQSKEEIKESICTGANKEYISEYIKK